MDFFIFLILVFTEEVVIASDDTTKKELVVENHHTHGHTTFKEIQLRLPICLSFLIGEFPHFII